MAACGEPSGSDVAPGVIDQRVPIPASDEQYLDLVTPEVTIGPAEERMYCLYMEHEGEDIAIRDLQASQGVGGHHIALVQASPGRLAGTLEDCTDADSAETMIPIAIPLPLPEGHGIRLRNGQRFVMQFHYININSAPIVVRDVARLQKIPIDEVTSWVSTFSTNSTVVDVLPEGISEFEWDCVLDRDLEIILIGGHMHERGKSMWIEAGADDAWRTLYTIPTWNPSFRDLPPIVPLFEEPELLAAGTKIRTRCQWDNPTDELVEFPEEMCASFGYIRSPEGYSCNIDRPR